MPTEDRVGYPRDGEAPSAQCVEGTTTWVRTWRGIEQQEEGVTRLVPTLMTVTPPGTHHLLF